MGSAIPSRSNADRRILHASHRPHDKPAGRRVVATVCQGVIHAERASSLDDRLLIEGQERGMNLEPACTLDPRAGRQVGECLERANELRPAIGIARIINAIDADPDVERPQRFGPGECE